MTIVAECPHCENRYNLQPDLAGKSMRCPNLSCRGIFTVKDVSGGAAVANAKPRAPQPAPEIVEAKVVEANVIEAKVVEQPREIQWSASHDEPRRAPRKVKVVAAEAVEDEGDSDAWRRRRQKKKGMPRVLVGGLAVAVLAVIGVGGFYIYRINVLGEGKLARKADDDLKAGQYPAAAKAFHDLAEEYPNSSELPRYQFCADLATVRAAAQSVANREDPLPSLQKFQAFVAANRESPFAKPVTGYGVDIYDAGAKVADDLADHAQDRVKKYQADRAKDDELSRAENAAGEGRNLLSVIKVFYDPALTPPDTIAKKFDQVERDLRTERERAGFLAQLRTLLAEPSDETIAQADAMVKERGLDAAPDVRQIVDSARALLRKFVKYVPDNSPPQAAPVEGGASILFAVPVGRTVPSFAKAGETPGVFLASARGILYAFDERGGSLQWATRTGSDLAGTPARYQPDDGSPEIVLVTSEVAGQPALTARRARTGQPLWHQPLMASAAGPAVIVGRRAYVPLRDPRGTIVEFDLAGGARLGSIAIGQPIGPGLARRAGTGLLYVAAEARRVFVLDVTARNDDGARLDPLCVQVIATEHSPGTLRTSPLVVGPEGVGPERRWLVLVASDGPRTSKVRVYSLAEPPSSLPANTEPPEVTAEPAAEFSVPGWPVFPPTCNGERLALATDAGQFRLFGVNQPGNQDRPLFPIAAPPPGKEREFHPLPGALVPGGDDQFWLLANGSLERVNLSLDPSKGQVLRPSGEPVPLGVPTQPPHVNAARDIAFFALRSDQSAGHRAVAVDLAEGKVLWTRQLGLVPHAPPVALDDRVLFADEDGGLLLMPRTAVEEFTTGDHAADAAWVLAPPFVNATGPTLVASTPDGTAAWAVTPHGPEAAPVFTIRFVSGGKVAAEAKVVAPAKLTGEPIVLGQSLLLPLADGFVYRFEPNATRLAAGPVWRDARGAADATCFLTALPNGEEFLATDGNRELRRFRWPADGSDWKRTTDVALRERIALAPAIVPGEGPAAKPAVLVVDATSSAWLYTLDSGDVVRRWRSGGASPIPAGPPAGGLALHTYGGDHVTAAYVADGRGLVILHPQLDVEPLVVEAAKVHDGAAFIGPPRATGEAKWAVVDLTGHVSVYDAETGQKLEDVACAATGALPSTAGTPLGHRVLVPLADGSAAVVSMPQKDQNPGAAAVEPAPEPRKAP